MISHNEEHSPRDQAASGELEIFERYKFRGFADLPDLPVSSKQNFGILVCICEKLEKDHAAAGLRHI